MDYQFKEYHARCFIERPKSVKIGKWMVNYLSFCKPQNQARIPLMIIRGGFQKYDSFSALVKTLMVDYPIILIELPGEGESRQNPFELELEDYADLLKDFIDILRIEKIIPIATSYGAFIAFLFAVRHPGRTQRLILGGITASIREDSRLIMERLVYYWARNRSKESSVLGLYSLINFDKIQLTQVNDLILRILEHSIAQLGFSARLRYFDRLFKNRRARLVGTPSCETLIFVGEYDHVTFPAENYQFGLGCPQCLLAVFQNSDHFLHLEIQKSVLALYQSFLAGDSIEATKGKVNDLKIYDEVSNIKPEDFDPPQYYLWRLEATLIENNKRKYPCTVIKINQNDCLLEMTDNIDFRNHIRASTNNKPLPVSSFGRRISVYRIFGLIVLERFFPSISEYKLEITNFNLSFEVIPVNNQNNRVRCLFINNDPQKYKVRREFIASLINEGKNHRRTKGKILCQK